MSVINTPNGYTLDNGGQRVVVDPVTRIEGHMRCEVNLDKNNVIVNAVSTGTMWRGLEVILRGRDPRDAWAFVERICGVCTGCHALASCRAVEDALDIKIPLNAHLIREMMAKTLQVHDHVVHFYHLHALDWVNPVNALKANPKATSGLQNIVSPKHAKSSPGYFKDIQTRIRKFIESGQLGPFKNGYWDNPAYKLSPEADLMAVAHYLEALDLQKEFVKLHTIFGGKNPHPNYLVGGVPCAINMDGDMAAGAPLNMERLNFVKSRIDEMVQFNNNVYVPDVIAIASFYKGQLWGGGIGAKSVMDYGAYPKVNYDKSTDQLPGGVILNDNWDEVFPVDPKDPEQVQEFVTHSWYKYPDETKGLHPWDGITEPNYELGSKTKGTRTDIKELDESAKYSWIKSPRWRGHAVEVGPLSRYVLAIAQGHEYITEQTTKALSGFNALAGTELNMKQALQSTIGRTLARALESEYCAEMMVEDWHALIKNIKSGDSSTANMEKWDPKTWPKNAKGVGTVAAPRGANAHWIVIKDGKIDNYQCIVPTTWNGSPRDPEGNIGAFEASLMGTPVERANEPVEILRTLHSFDPCLACSTHIMSEEGEELINVKVR
ncbi:Uptake hydrogenase large subunit (EC 1.12.99.6) [uncultured Gammaproteobacteria bacterium]|jgi:hydrogenase large subunit|uniref:Uptake hydrogenase large subunit n=2 Tax=Bathymodiolus azoricus thioautotrophic gill symbiont TaxID=235205 RepID=A0A1H6JKA9_9GAMM|nr:MULTISPECIES: nickel-dependent hydrogenase large subunit [Gammaproteobacteria]CAC9484559.1 Uptake [NiFe] hydrogenase, large subunit HyaB (EC 1.12.99.6) [uncultured Gammaproteobacteria bacterium]CAB5507550.1 Uptake [NiFe] hydrogenase, large subunit HyaB (EC [Bathymodiolus azoricus thioautotrophic gill symbiont]CAC9491726.1 Uptake hydrogenase large subunit (EC 1.12.99.6) [uncultured Gammaproteobacteria bacterium]CAC9493156.1 Uptake hydrogenase large subunit (EC 1.12.99.6) [uncultured Gammaprot